MPKFKKGDKVKLVDVINWAENHRPLIGMLGVVDKVKAESGSVRVYVNWDWPNQGIGPRWPETHIERVVPRITLILKRQ